ncbi:hypothetical protein [Hyalangium sp.]|uniref:hypothetical protein n=1 Tax=Hyalangium sp. TaxID=2028555 RepID=UPI002D3F000A|nr:hypothetical protein [Hyalangium sp.]HYH97935.1 hypothetical protein [Hyalangium sp.]
MADTRLTRGRASPFTAALMMVVISLVLFFLPLINGLIGGAVGGYMAGSGGIVVLLADVGLFIGAAIGGAIAQSGPRRLLA